MAHSLHADRTRRRRLTPVSVAVMMTLATGGLIALTSPASANPADVPAAFSQSTPGAFGGTVSDGVCEVEVTARGGAGGSVITGVENTNGAGAVISATYPVVPGQDFTGYVGGGGQPSTGAAGQPGNGGPIAGVGGEGNPGSS